MVESEPMFVMAVSRSRRGRSLIGAAVRPIFSILGIWVKLAKHEDEHDRYSFSRLVQLLVVAQWFSRRNVRGIPPRETNLSPSAHPGRGQDGAARLLDDH